jgi:NTE family protein
MDKIDTLVCGGGGVRCIGTIGALIHLEKEGILKNIKRYAGTSAGSIIIVLLNIGYTPQEIFDTIFSQSNAIVHDSVPRVIYNLFSDYGLYSGNKMMSYLGTLFQNKGFNKDITLKEMFIKTNKILVITATSLNTRNTYFFSYQTFPDTKVIDAVRMSISIPGFFSSVSYVVDGVSHRFVDGGILQNYPLDYYDICESQGKFIKTFNELSEIKKLDKLKCRLTTPYQFNTVGIMILDKNNNRDIYDFFTGFDQIYNITSFIESIYHTILNKIDQDNFYNPITGIKKNFFKRTITVMLDTTVSAIDFGLSDEVKQKLIKTGEDSAKSFFENS